MVTLVLLFLFLSTPSARRATHRVRHQENRFQFLSTPSARRATAAASAPTSRRKDFYPRPPRGGRLKEKRTVSKAEYDFYPRPPRGGRPGAAGPSRRPPRISIHALREEGDQQLLWCSPRSDDFYPRPPRGGRPSAAQGENRPKIFLSTPSARRATQCKPWTHQAQFYFYPRPPRGGRQPNKTQL